MDISIIVPVFNEEQNLLILYKKIISAFENLNKNFEIIFIDDGSSDKSFRVLEEIKAIDTRIRVIKFYKNYGQTSALAAGLFYARGDFILTIDADLQYNPRDLIRIFKELENNDVVITYRVNRRIVDGNIKFIASKIANHIRNKVLKENFKDVGFLRGYRKKCLDRLVLYRGFQVFIPSFLNMEGYRIKEIEVESYPRRYGKSKYNIKNRLFRELFALMIVKWMQKNRLKYRIKYSG